MHAAWLALLVATAGTGVSAQLTQDDLVAAQQLRDEIQAVATVANNEAPQQEEDLIVPVATAIELPVAATGGDTSSTERGSLPTVGVASDAPRTAAGSTSQAEPSAAAPKATAPEEHAVAAVAAATNNAVEGDADDAKAAAALSFLRDRLAAAGRERMELKRSLAQAKQWNHTLGTEVAHLRHQRNEVIKRFRASVAQREAKARAALTAEVAKERAAKRQLANTTGALATDEAALRRSRNELHAAQKANSELVRLLANATATGHALDKALLESRRRTAAEGAQLQNATAQRQLQGDAVTRSQAELQALQVAKAKEDAQLQAVERRDTLLQKREQLEDVRAKHQAKEIKALKDKLGTEKARESQLHVAMVKDHDALTEQLAAATTNATGSAAALREAQVETARLRAEVEKLRQRAGETEQTEAEAEQDQKQLQTLEAENRQLRGSVPWLEAEVRRQKDIAQNASANQAALTKEHLELQGKYAEVLSSLVGDQGGKQGTSGPEPPHQQPAAPTAESHLAHNTGSMGVASLAGERRNLRVAAARRQVRAKPAESSTRETGRPISKALTDLERDSENLNSLLAGLGEH